MGLSNPIHIIFLLALVLLVFGAKRLPELGRSLGSGMRVFRDALSGTDTGDHPLAQGRQATLVEPALVRPAPEVTAPERLPPAA